MRGDVTMIACLENNYHVRGHGESCCQNLYMLTLALSMVKPPRAEVRSFHLRVEYHLGGGAVLRDPEGFGKLAEGEFVGDELFGPDLAFS